MEKQYTVPEFLKMTPPQKERLRQRDPEQYKRLFVEAERDFSPKTDYESARILAGKEE